MPPSVLGYLAALTSILIWGSTFVVTKTLLAVWAPTQLLVLRFALAGLILLPWSKGFFRWAGWATERTWALLGLTGVSLYYLGENVALALADATEVGLLVSTIPLWTAAAAWWLGGDRRPNRQWLIGTAAALTGLGLVVGPRLAWGGSPAGLLAALGAAVAFTAYSRLLRRLPVGTASNLTLSRAFLWGAAFAAVVLPLEGPGPSVGLWTTPQALGGLAFLVLAASVAAYGSWNAALARLGATRTNTTIYLVPVVNSALAVTFLGEPLTALSALGCLLIVGGTAAGSLRKGP